MKIKLLFVLLIIVSGALIAQDNAIIRLKVVRDTHQDETIVKFKSDATYFFDSSYDASKMFSSNTLHPQIWTRNHVANDNYAINTIPLLQGFISIKLGFKTNHAQNHTIQAYDFALIDTLTRFYLHDLLLDSLINLRESPTYSFNSGVVNNVNRFLLYFAAETTYSGGLWNYGLPDSLVSGIILDGTFTIEDTTIAAYDLTIHPCAALTVAHNGTLKVNGNLNILSSGLETGSLINHGTITVEKETRFYKLFEDITVHGWNISIPVTDAPLALFDDADAMWEFDAATGQWQNVSVPTLETMRGYVTRFNNQDKTIVFNGTLNNGVLAHNNLLRTGDNSGNFGWNLIGNPYPSAMHWDSIPQNFKTNLNNAIYFRMLNGNVAAYVNGNSTNGGSPVIPPIQAFWVQVQSGQTLGVLTIPDNALTHHCQPNYKKSTSVSSIKISLNNDNFSDETIIALNDNATWQFDKLNDAVKMFSNNPTHLQVYSIINNKNYAINAFPEPQNHYALPIGYISPIAETLNISFAGIDLFSQKYNIRLEDTYNNSSTLLTQQSSYSFSSPTGTVNDRFLLHFEPHTLGVENGNTNDNYHVYLADKHINIRGTSDDTPLKYFEIINTLGQNSTTVYINDNKKTFPFNFSKGIYFVNLYNENNKLISTHKIVAP